MQLLHTCENSKNKYRFEARTYSTLTNVVNVHEIILVQDTFVIFYGQTLKTSFRCNNPAEPLAKRPGMI